MSHYDLDKWYQEPLGSSLLELEKRCLEDILPGFFGNYLLQPASMFASSHSSVSPIYHSITIGSQHDKAEFKPTVVGDILELPFFHDSIDLVLLPHVLEFQAKPQQLLAEAYRVLKPQGHLVILGFNPLSSWGIWRMWRRFSKQCPWPGKFISADKVRHWLKQMNAQTVETRYIFYRPPLKNLKLLQNLMFMEYLSRFSWLGFGAAYVLVAQKQVIPLKPIRAPWRQRQVAIGKGFAEPTIRGGIK